MTSVNIRSNREGRQTQTDRLRMAVLLCLLCCMMAACAPDSTPLDAPADSPASATESVVDVAPTATTRLQESPSATLPMDPTVTPVSADSPAPPLSLCSGNGTLESVPVSAELRTRLDPIFAQLQARSPQASVSLALQCGDGPVHVLAVGDAAIEAGVPATPDTVYALASLTKQVTAAAVLRLVEQGDVELDAPIGRYLPQWPTAGGTITVRHLLNHTAGVFSYTRLYGPGTDLSAEISPDALIAQFENAPLDFQPGQQFSYSDSGYVLLGALIESVTGLPYADYVRQQILAPAGLTHIAYCAPVPAGLAQPYELRGGALQAVPVIHFSHAYSAGGLCGTAAEMARWQRALHSGQVVGERALAEMRRSGVTGDGVPTGYGFGLFIDAQGGNLVYGHNGVAPGYAAWAQYSPSNDLSVVLLANTVPGAFLLQETAQQIVEQVAQVR